MLLEQTVHEHMTRNYVLKQYNHINDEYLPNNFMKI